MKFPQEVLQQCWFLAGPTASGKSSTGLLLAKAIDAEILSLDSMAVFRKMDIGTAKPTLADRDRVPHHLIDLIDPWEDFSTADYLSQSLAACQQILSRGKKPLFVGGTGLYLRAILRGVFEGPAADWDFRNRLEAQAATEAPDWLYRQLTLTDPVSANRLHQNDSRRLIRALEIQHLTGKTASEQHQQAPLPKQDQPTHVYWLHPDRDWLYERINQRVEEMFEAGLVEEVQHLLALEHPISRTAQQALGYRELLDWLNGSLASEEEAKELIKTRTRQFAKRQHTWFRNLEECQAITVAPDTNATTLVQQILNNTESATRAPST